MSVFAENIKNASGNVSVEFGRSATTDAFGRGRTADPFTLHENKNIMSGNSLRWSEVTSGGGSSIVFDISKAAVELTAGTGATDYAIRQSRRYYAYAPGEGHLAKISGVMGAQKTNVKKRIGYFDDNDGLFFEQDGTEGNRVVVRSSVSGSVVDTAINQSNWNVDTMDGFGRSGITLDMSKAQVFVIDFQWLGVGSVRYGFDINGILYYVHEENHANLVSEVYMRTPSLPVRYEIRNTGVPASATTMDEICSAVISEGGYVVPGLEFGVNSGGGAGAFRSVTTRQPVLAVRLKNSFNGIDNRRSVRILDTSMSSSSQEALFELAHIHDPTSVTASWTDVGGGSACEYSTDISVVTGGTEHIIGNRYIPASTQGGQARPAIGGVSSQFINEHSYLSQNFDSTNSQLFVLYATSMSASASDIVATIEWIEFD